MVGKWHTVSHGRHDESQDEQAFRNQGPLVSISREPPQNSTDNQLDKALGPVILRYSFRNLPAASEMENKYLPQNPWVNHVTAPGNSETTSYLEDYGKSLLDSVRKNVKVLIVEDYNATGLVGDTRMLYPNTDDPAEYNKETQDNTFFWFLRSKGAKRPVVGRGGSWGLGKLAFPLASSVRTFFVVTTRKEGDRYLTGQAILKNHKVHGDWFSEMMYFADEKMGENEHHWAPISDSSSIDEFCNAFAVSRNENEPGTSMVIVLPKKELNSINLKQCLLSNYCVPIMSGKLQIEISSEEGDIEVITDENVREVISELNWTIPKSLKSAWTTSERMEELVNLYDAIEGFDCPDPIKLGKPIKNKKTNTAEQFERVLPERGTTDLQKITQDFNSNQVVVFSGKMPVHHKDGSGVKEGTYFLALRKCEDSEAAEAHFYRGHISVPLNNDRKPSAESVASLLVVGEEGCPLAELLRSSEGPAHLKWDTTEDGMKRRYDYGQSTILFLREIVGKIVTRITSVDTKKEDIWTDIFSLGEKPEPPDIERRFRIEEREGGGGCNITPLELKEDIVGYSFIVRVGYPKNTIVRPKKAPDPRIIDVHSMTWNAEGATITKDVFALNGDLCVDRVRMTVREPDFSVDLIGVNSDLKAQIMITEGGVA